MEYKVEEQGEKRATVRLVGRLDASSAPILRDALKDCVAHDLTALVVDMEGISFIDSSGLSALVSGFRSAREQEGTLVLACAGPQVRVALELTRLNQVFAIYEDVEAALASLAE